MLDISKQTHGKVILFSDATQLPNRNMKPVQTWNNMAAAYGRKWSRLL